MIKSVLRIRLDGKKAAQAVDEALSPDNINLPSGMKISQLRRLSELKISVAVESVDQLSSLISTLDEILAHAQTASKVLE